MPSTPGVWEEVAPPATRTLDPEHRAVLEEVSNIDPAVIDARGYYSLTKAQISELVQQEIIHPSSLRAESWMGIPIYRPDGEKHGEIIRRFTVDKSDKFKYIWPTGLRLCFDVHPDCFGNLNNPEIPIMITEGIKKADAILSAARRESLPLVVLAANGCDGWKTKVSGSTVALPDFYDIAWTDRRVYVNSDSDYRTNNRVSAGWNGCATYVSGKTGEHKTLLVVTPPNGLDKQGADDFLARGHNIRDLLEYAQTPERAVLDQSGEREPLKLKGGLQLIREAGDKIPHLMAPLIPERSITLVAGHSGTYKTWNMLGLALDGAFGLPWLGHPDLTNEHGPFTTLYVNKEMAGTILGSRLKTLARNERYTSIPDYEEIIDARLQFSHDAELDLNNEEQRDRLEDAILASGARIVILDSLSMCWHGDENSAAEVGTLYAQLRGIIERTGCTFMILHHLLKPSGGKAPKKDEPVSQFSIRGSGQLYQQADACIMLRLYSGSAYESDDQKSISMHHVKARTSLEMPAWVATFSSNDGLFQSLTYTCALADARARAYAESSGDATKLKAWIVEACYSMPAMLPGPGNPGFRSKALYLMLQQAWTVPDKPAPSEDTLRRQVQALVNEGVIVLLEENKRSGNLYRLAEQADEEESVEVAPTSTGSVTSPTV